MSDAPLDRPRAACIFAISARTSLGTSAVASAATARAGVSRFVLTYAPRIAGRHTFTIAPAPDAGPFSPGSAAPSADRIARLAGLAAADIAAAIPLRDLRSLRVFLGMPSHRAGLGSDAEIATTGAEIARAFAEPAADEGKPALPNDGGEAPRYPGARRTLPNDGGEAPPYPGARRTLPNDGGEAPPYPGALRTPIDLHFEAIARGNASGFAALARAVAHVAEHPHDVCIVGGADSYLATDTLAELHRTEQLKSERNRWGFVPGEAAAFVAVASSAFLENASLAAMAEVVSVGVGEESVVPRSDEPLLGKGLSQALRAAIRPLNGDPAISALACDLNGERWRGDEVAFSVARIGGAIGAAGALATPASAYGDVGAAWAPLLISGAIHGARRGEQGAHTTLVWASSEQGLKGAAVLRRAVDPRE